MRRSAALAALSERQFRLLFTGQLVSLLGDSFTQVALAFAVLDLTGSATDLGIVFAAKMIPLVGFLLVGGVFADRLERRVVMLAADVVRLGTQGSVALLVLTHTAQIWHIVVLQAIAGTATAFFNPASTGLTPLTISPERLQQANALRGLSMASTGIVGTALGGVVVSAIGAGWALAVDSASYGVSAIFLAQLVLPEHVKLPPQSFLRDLHDGWREFVSRTWVWVIVVAASVGNMMSSIYSVLVAVVAKRSLGGPLALSVILGAMGAGSLVGGVVALRVRVHRPLLFGSSLLSFLAVPMLLLAAGAPVVAIAAGSLLAGVANMVFNSLWETALQQHVPPAALSRVSAYDWFGSLAFAPLGLAIAGPLSGAIGTGETLVAAAVGSLLMTIVCVATPSVRAIVSHPPPVAADAPALS